MFALTAGIGLNCVHGGAFAHLGAVLRKTCGFWTAKACWLFWKAVAVADGGGILHIFIGYLLCVIG